MKRTIASVGFALCTGIMLSAAAFAADDIKIGVLYDYTGPFAGGGPGWNDWFGDPSPPGPTINFAPARPTDLAM